MYNAISTENFREIVRAHQERVYHVIRKMVIDHDDTDDLVQEVFVKVWQKRDSFNGESQLFTWIYRIAVNEALQFLRKKKRQQLIPIDEEDNMIERKLKSELSLDADEVQFQLQKAIALLPEKQKAVFIMKYYDEVPYEEMANIMGGSVGGLKASYHHAVKKIENSLKAGLNH
ncbi:RNA polymerase sigma factor [Fulvivirga sedimenti]|uniref:RNA polymerase sigma factor n=1 Tax=Fulvivirga sedimenti TaxID=2879465 RepID=A0A9X1HTI0_9BACT|nr:sigma-70 family RNA polymerase sigma factor [Fulvivirga sedimenti]MCA6074700.1 sigma-70 family RNA polymerase sigma factor [Fulvivirga sedimenti]MCA6075877.1 sigma-70 family RNA polymerase sigma factor [Fulvivirga sedimenti]MCA6077005.1 sigma-70 family RNA polymerase sigma factor [Fulvivirga sedimenti]